MTPFGDYSTVTEHPAQQLVGCFFITRPSFRYSRLRLERWGAPVPKLYVQEQRLANMFSVTPAHTFKQLNDLGRTPPPRKAGDQSRLLGKYPFRQPTAVIRQT